MALIIRPKFTREQLTALVKGKLQRFNDAVLLRFIRIGEEFVNNARNNHTYTDRTGNLTSSIGYVLLKDGVQVHDNFLNHPGPELTTDQPLHGQETGRAIAADLATKYPTGLVLICVAGMDYAAAVESKGFDVITSSAITAKDDLPRQLNNLISKVA